ncbi:WSC domain-containing protein [Peziza echinospora]|nr:WSC domain-containing protein [Peziza echinospora]
MLLWACVLFALVRLPTLSRALHVTDTITSGGDNTRSGYQIYHNLDPAVVGSSQFGIIWRKKLLGNYNGWTEQIYAQALVYTPDPTGKQFVYVASQMNMIYKIDAITGDILLSRNLHIPFLVAELDGCNDISYCIGSTATGVIDPETDTWFLTTKTYRDQSGVEKGKLNGRYFIHAIDVHTLGEKPNFPINLEGLIASNNPIRMFQGGIHHQRPALMQSGPYIYAGFASHCVHDNFTGWVIGWHGQTGEIVAKFATQGGPENKKGGGIWMSGGGLASDGPGRMFFGTGNGHASQLDKIPVPGRQPPTALEEAVVHMAILDDGSLKVVDFFMPWEKTQLDGADKDLGTSGIALLDPAVFSTPTVRRIGCIAGKSGKLYFLNLDDLGGYQMGKNKKDAVLQVVELKNSVFATAGSYPGGADEGAYVYVNVVQHETVVFKFSIGPAGEPVFTQVAETLEKTAYVLGVGHGTSTSLQNRPGTGLYWVSDIQGLNLRVYNAVPVGGRLQLVKGLNIPGQVKFSRPSFGNGRVYLTTSNGYLIMVGSPVNPPLSCTGPTEFGEVTVGSEAIQSVSCQAKITIEITAVTVRLQDDFMLSSGPLFPLRLVKGENVTFNVVFRPKLPGPLSDDIQIWTMNSLPNYANATTAALRGIGRSLNPILFISPNTVSFPGIITGANPEGTQRSFVLYNQGESELLITDYDLSVISENGPWLPKGTLEAGPYAFSPLPTVIPPRGSATIVLKFNPTENGNYGAYLLLKSNGGNRFLTVVGTSGGYPRAKLEFGNDDGWVEFKKDDPGFVFDFGPVYQQKTKTLSLRLTNAGSADASILGVTISKPPIGAELVIGARNGIDLGEGTQLLPGQSATALLFCSVPKSQVNVDEYTAFATWTLNVDDPDFGKQELQFKCSAVAEQQGPLNPLTGQGRYRYTGCFKSSNPDRQMDVRLYGSNNLTNGMCMQDCFAHKRNYRFAGTQYHRECWCDMELPNLKVSDVDCNFDCSGDGTQICGGNGYFGGGSYISLFVDSERSNGSVSTTAAIPTSTSTKTVETMSPTINPGNPQFGYAGCFAEPTSGGRALPTLWSSDNMTVNACLERCAGLNYAGLEYGRECWCGTAIRPQATQRPHAECDILCAKNETEYCGARRRLGLYTKQLSQQTTTMSSNTTGFLTTSTVAFSTIDNTNSETTPTSSTTPAPSETEINVHPGTLGYTFAGCFQEPLSAHILSDGPFENLSLTLPRCIEICSSSGHTFAGVEGGMNCWCGSELGSDVNQTTIDECNIPCGGDQGHSCGGNLRLLLYQRSVGKSYPK